MSFTAIDGLGPSVNSKERKAGRIASTLVGAGLLAIMYTVDPSREPLRFVFAVGAIVMIARGVAGCRPAPPAPAPDGNEPCRCGASAALVELELALFDHRVSCDDTAADVSERVDRIMRMVAELSDQVR